MLSHSRGLRSASVGAKQTSTGRSAPLKHLKSAHFSMKNGSFSVFFWSQCHAFPCEHGTHDLSTLASYYPAACSHLCNNFYTTPQTCTTRSLYQMEMTPASSGSDEQIFKFSTRLQPIKPTAQLPVYPSPLPLPSFPPDHSVNDADIELNNLYHLIADIGIYNNPVLEPRRRSPRPLPLLPPYPRPAAVPSHQCLTE